MLSKYTLFTLISALAASASTNPKGIPFGRTAFEFQDNTAVVVSTAYPEDGNFFAGQLVMTTYKPKADLPGYVWTWEINPAGHLVVPGTDFCIDAGKEPKEGDRLRLQVCSESATEQNWVVHNDRVELVGTGFCFDIRNGEPVPQVHSASVKDGGLQLGKCVDGSENQIFKVVERDPGHA